MSFFLRVRRPSPDAIPMPAQVPSPAEQRGAAFSAQQMEDDSWWQRSRDEMSLIDQLAEQTGIDRRGMGAEWLAAGGQRSGQTFRQFQRDRILAAAAEAAQADPGAWANLPTDADAFEAELTRRRRTELEGYQETLRRGENGGAQFVGGLAGAALDPASITAGILGGAPGAGWRGFARFVGREAGLGAGAEAVILPRAMEVAEELDQPAPDPVSRIALGAALGAGFAGVFGGAVRLVEYHQTRYQAEAAARPAEVQGPEYADAVGAAETALRTDYEGMTPTGMAATNRGAVDPSRAFVVGVSGNSANPRAMVRLPDGSILRDIGPGTDLPGLGRVVQITDGQVTIERDGASLTVGVGDALGEAPSGPSAQVATAPAPRRPDPALPPQEDPVVQDVLGLIQQIEADRGFDQVTGFARIAPERPITTMTVNEVLDWQRRNIAAGAQSSAAGGFQIINSTLRSLVQDMDLTGSELFDEAMQTAMAVQLMRRRGLDDWRTGRLSDEQFANNLAQEWAALPVVTGPRAGRSFYAGDGLNASRTTPQAILGALRGQGGQPRSRPAGGGAPVDPPAFAPDTRRAGMTTGGEVVSPVGTRVEVDYEVVELSSLVRASGDLQPRDRSRAASDEQINEIAAGLDPARLMPSPEADRGAPVVGPDQIVESGNGRIAAIQRASELHPERYDAYVGSIRQAGFDIPEGMQRPVLVARRRSDLTPEQRRNWVRENNTSAIARMGGAEQARSDAAAIPDAAFNAYRPGQPLTSAANAPFVRTALAGIPQAERGALYTADGRLSLDGLQRVRAALFARAWGADDLLRLLLESPSPELRALIQVMEDLAPDWASFRAAVDGGIIRQELDITDQVVDIVRTIGRTRADDRQGQSVVAALRDALAQVDMFRTPDEALNAALLDVFYPANRARQPEAVGDILRRYTDEAAQVGRSDAADLFQTPPPPDAVLRAAIKAHDARAPRVQPTADAPEPPAPPATPIDMPQLVDGAASPVLARVAGDTLTDARAALDAPQRPAEAPAAPAQDAPPAMAEAPQDAPATAPQAEAARPATPDPVAELAALRDQTFRLEADGPEVTLRDVLDDLDAEDTLVATLELCARRTA
jgi:hypothetical protein